MQKKYEATLTAIADVPPAGDVALHATGKKGARGRQANGTDPIRPGQGGGEAHQGYILTTVRLHISGRDHHIVDAVRRLVRVQTVHVVPAGVNGVRAHVGWTERRLAMCSS